MSVADVANASLSGQQETSTGLNGTASIDSLILRAVPGVYDLVLLLPDYYPQVTLSQHIGTTFAFQQEKTFSPFTSSTNGED